MSTEGERLLAEPHFPPPHRRPGLSLHSPFCAFLSSAESSSSALSDSYEESRV